MNARSLLPLLFLGFATPALARGGHEYAYGAPQRAPTGIVQVVNRAGTVLTVTVDGAAPRTVAPDQVVNISAIAGEVRVRATYRLFGQELTLRTERTWVTPGRTSSTAFYAPTTARVLVTNSTPVPASVVAEGREVAALGPGQERLLTLPARATTLSLYADGHLVRTQRLELRPYDEPRLRVEMPTRGDLVVQNPLPIPVQLVAGAGPARTVEPYGRATFTGLPVGTVEVSALRLTGEPIDTTCTRIDPWVAVTWRVDPPQDGLVLVDNDHWLGVKVFVDGRVSSTLRAEQDTRLLLGVGWHHVEVRDDAGREILDDWIEVERYDTVRIDAGTHRAPPVADAGYDRHGGHHDRDERDHEDDGRYDDHEAAEYSSRR